MASGIGVVASVQIGLEVKAQPNPSSSIARDNSALETMVTVDFVSMMSGLGGSGVSTSLFPLKSIIIWLVLPRCV